MTKLMIGLLAAAGIALAGAPVVAAEDNPMETFVVKVVCEKVSEGWSLDKMANQLVADQMVYNADDGRTLVLRAVAKGCPESAEGLQ